ncbi:MAG TPA: hypothetical protein VL294_12205 [Pseudolysinimonas sp.]|nr:hypothetical protein [Pseudolysinimonas sp.]
MAEKDAASKELDAILEILAGATETRPAPEESPAVRRDRASADDAELDVKLKKMVAAIALILMAIQIVVADIVFVVYGNAQEWKIDTPAISAWLGATVIEVIGVVLVIASYLFPKRTKAT